MASVLAGTQLRGSFSEKLLGLKDEVRRAGGKVVVFIDEIHTLMGAGSTGEGPQDAANELKAALARGEFPCIGATTHDEYRQLHPEGPGAGAPLLPGAGARAVGAPRPSPSWPGWRRATRSTTASATPPEALEAAASLSARYITDRFLPDKAIAVLDLAGVRAPARGHRRTSTPPTSPSVVAKLAGLPGGAAARDSDRERLLGLEEELGERVIGHAEVIGRRRPGRSSATTPASPRAGRWAPSSSSAPPASARPSWPSRWPTCSSARATRWCSST